MAEGDPFDGWLDIVEAARTLFGVTEEDEVPVPGPDPDRAR